jgi:hypothetical protein
MKKNLLWLVWIFLVTVYFTTITAVCAAGRYSALAFAMLNLACAVFLFFAEGFEVAFCMLWPVRNSAESDIRDSLQDLDHQFVLAQRQVIVVVTITIVGITTSALPWIEIPGLGKVQWSAAPFLFGLLFTTSTILWFSQVFPKLVAARYPDRFWRISKWVLKPVNAGRIFDLPAPSSDLVFLWERFFGRAQCRSSQTTYVPSLWASCDCPVCKPNRMAVAAPFLEPCNCPICEPISSIAA